MKGYDKQWSQKQEAIKGRSCKQNWKEKKTQNKYGSCATHSKWSQYVNRMMIMMIPMMDQVYSNIQVSTQVSTTQHKFDTSMNQHEFDTGQHESKTSLDQEK